MLLRLALAVQLMSLPLHAFAADELPKDLHLLCEGRMDAVLDLPSPQSRSATFRLNLHLKDGSITDTQTGVIEGEACVQNGGEIKCEVTKHYPQANSIIKRHSSVVFNRGTRSLTSWVESWDYQGNETSGTPTAHMRVLRTGLCRDDELF
jgi:hypothetical protein